MDAESAEDNAAHPLRMRQQKECGDPRAHGIAQHVRARDTKMIEQPPRVFGHDRRAIRLRIVEFPALTVAAIVVGDDAAPGLPERADPVGVEPIRDNVGGKAMDQEDGIALPLVHKGDPHAIGIEALHS